VHYFPAARGGSQHHGFRAGDSHGLAVLLHDEIATDAGCALSGFLLCLAEELCVVRGMMAQVLGRGMFRTTAFQDD